MQGSRDSTATSRISIVRGTVIGGPPLTNGCASAAFAVNATLIPKSTAPSVASYSKPRPNGSLLGALSPLPDRDASRWAPSEGNDLKNPIAIEVSECHTGDDR